MATLSRTGVAAGEFEAIGTTNVVLCTRPDALAQALDTARWHLRLVDSAVSRFRPDSEVTLLAARAQHGPASAFVSPTFADYLAAALFAARLTGGLVDPTVGAALAATGYDVDLGAVRARGVFRQTAVRPVPRWTSVHLDLSGRRVSVAPHTLLDLGATAKAHAADTIATRLADTLPGGFLVNLGGDIAVAGDLPAAGWAIGIEGADGRSRQTILSTGQAVATSSTRARVWQTDDGPRHHIIDPRTGRTGPTTWAQVSCAAASALEANAASTAAIVLGPDAPGWLEENGIPARLEALDGSVTVTAGWPDAESRTEGPTR